MCVYFVWYKFHFIDSFYYIDQFPVEEKFFFFSKIFKNKKCLNYVLREGIETETPT